MVLRPCHRWCLISPCFIVPHPMLPCHNLIMWRMFDQIPEASRPHLCSAWQMSDSVQTDLSWRGCVCLHREKRWPLAPRWDEGLMIGAINYCSESSSHSHFNDFNLRDPTLDEPDTPLIVADTEIAKDPIYTLAFMPPWVTIRSLCL